jgi:DNA-binding PadR family transcriptional regulator
VRRKPGSIIGIERAVLETGLALQALGVAEFHGYLLAREMRAQEGARRLVSHGTLYKALDRMETSGLITSRWEDPHDAARENRPRRRLYHLTAEGENVVARLRRAERVATLVLREEPAV